MTVWKKFTGSAELLEEMRNAKNGLIVRTKDGFESSIINGESVTVCSGGLVEEYLICEPHPHEEMIIQWAMTGQTVYCRPTDCKIWVLDGKPAWDPAWEYSFNPPVEKKKEFIEVREYLCKSTNDVTYYTGTVIKNESCDSVKFAEQRRVFVRWIDADWRKVEI